MDSIGIDTSCDPVYHDIAFKLPENQPSGINVSDGSQFTVGLGVMNYCGWYGNTDAAAVIYATYLKKLSKFAVWALEHGYRVRLLSGDTADQSAVEDLVEAVKDQRGACVRNVVVEPAHSLHDVMRQLADVDILVATRFHNVVCALKMGKPVISIGYSDKNDTLMADMGLGDFCQHVEQLDVVLLIDQFTKLLAGRAKHESNIRERISNYQQRLIHQDSMLLSTFL
jgi:polysaccharide pyruvyl transferase WcaK-like protein